MSSPHQSVPPAKSSHTPAAGSDTGGSSDPSRPQATAQVIRIPQLAYLGVLVLLFCVFFPFVGWPVALWWLLLIPVVAVVWVARTRTTISQEGLDLRTIFRSRHLDWSQIAGVRIPKRGFVRAHLTDDKDVKLPAVSYDRLRDLIAASGGRIPDLFAAAQEAEDREYEQRRAEAESEQAGSEQAGSEQAGSEQAGSEQAEAKAVTDANHETESNGAAQTRETDT
ncbi:PH domain-containing protein [Nocardia australiensis]|uniref:PH domain-containing protein n=1 Tax=Nocardia australiensis TaxID=2887191 RepID=UPI001D14B8A9|nr:PH domain-containing protein [Nocardia australiensis]